MPARSWPDSYNSFESSGPGQPSIPMYPVQDSLPAAWELSGTTAEAGIQATAGGYDIDPHWPFRSFTWDTSVVGVSYAPGRADGYIRALGNGTVSMRVRAPAGAGAHLILRTGPQRRQLTVQAGFALWTMPVTSQQTTTWTLARA